MPPIPRQEEFADAFGGEARKARVPEREFFTYYVLVGSCVPGEEAFDLLVRSTWALPGGAGAPPATRRALVMSGRGTMTPATAGDDPVPSVF